MRVDIKNGACVRSYFFDEKTTVNKIIKMFFLADKICINKSQWIEIDKLKKLAQNKTLGGLVN